MITPSDVKAYDKILSDHKRILTLFQELWNKRANLIKELVSKKDVTQEILILNNQEIRLVKLLDSSASREILDKILKNSPEELKEQYKRMSEFSKAWYDVIGVHKNFLMEEQKFIPNFLKSNQARKGYFHSLELALKTYVHVVERYEEEKMLCLNIKKISQNKISNLPSTTIASFKHGLYRILAATVLGTIVFGDQLPGGTFGTFMAWAIHVNIAGTVISFLDIKLNTALNIRGFVENIIYVIRPTINKTSALWLDK